MAVPTWDEWTAHAEALQKAFADWKDGCTPPSQLTDDDSDLEHRAYAVEQFPGKDLTWRELLQRMDDRIWAFYLTEQAWLYYLPAFLMFPRPAYPEPDAGVIGYDLWVLAFPPGTDDWDEVVSIKTLLSSLNDEQAMVVRNHVRLHALSFEHETNPDARYALRIWEAFWRDHVV